MTDARIRFLVVAARSYAKVRGRDWITDRDRADALGLWEALAAEGIAPMRVTTPVLECPEEPLHDDGPRLLRAVRD